MSFPRPLVSWSVSIALAPALFAEPVPKQLGEPFPAVPASALKVPAPDSEQALPRDDAGLRPTARPSLLPDGIPSLPSLPGVPPGNPKKTGGSVPGLASAASELDLRIRYRKARNVAEENEKVRAAWNASRTARTDDAKRQALRRYEDLLFAKMLAIDRAIAPLVEARRKAEKPLLEQTQIAPTIPNDRARR